MKPKSARRLSEVGLSEIRELFELSQGIDGVIDLGIGEPDFETPEHIKKAYIAALENGNTKYASSLGDPELRRAISEKCRKDGLSINPDSEVLVTNGAVEAIYLAINSLVNPGDEVIVPDPGFLLYPRDVLIAEARPVSLPVLETEDIPMHLNEAITPKTKMLILNHPANPTGMTIEKRTARAVAEIVQDNDLILLSDEVYGKIVFDQPHMNMASLGIQDRTITVNSLSKTYAMAGLRVGFATGPKDLIALMAKLHQFTTTCINSAAQKAAVAALEGPQDCVNKMVREYKGRRDLLVAGLNKIEGIDCPTPGGAFYAFPDIRETGMSSEQLSAKLLKEAKVATVPGNAFGKQGEGHLRVSYTVSCEKIEEAIGRIRELLNTTQQSS